jgi:hypothetical protein
VRSVRLCCRGKKHVDQEMFSNTVNATYGSNPRLPRLREAASALPTDRHYSALNADENPARPCQMLSRESEALEPRGNAVPEIGSLQNTVKGKDLWHSWKCEAEERCQSIRICRNVGTQNLLVQLDSPSLGLDRMSSPDFGVRHLHSSFDVRPTGPSHLHQNARVDRLVRAQLSGISAAM